MNKIKNKLFPIITLALVFTLTACLNDETPNNTTISGGTKGGVSQSFVEVHLTSGDNSNVVSRAYSAMDKDTTLAQFIPIVLTSGPTKKDVTITYQVLDTLNSGDMKSYVKNDGYVIPDYAKFTLLNTNNTIVIPAGSSVGYVKVKFKPLDFLGDTYIFGVKVKSISDSVNYKLSNLTTGFVKFGIKNMYDGDYELEGSMVDGVNGALVGAYPNEVYLITQDGTSVAMFDVAVGNYAHLIKDGSSLSYYGIFAPVFKFDASNNVTAVTNIYGQPAGNGRSAQLDPSGINKYDATTGKLSVSYWMNQPGSTHRTHFVETFTYLGPR